MRVLTIFVWLVGISGFGNAVLAQTIAQEYYVTIGVFGVQDNAIRYTDRANKMGFSSQYAINTRQKLYYVYLLQTSDRKKANAFIIKLKAESQFKDAWPFIGQLGHDQPIVEKPAVVEKKPTPADEKKEIVAEEKKPAPVEEKKEPTVEEKKEPPVVVVPIVKDEPAKPVVKTDSPAVVRAKRIAKGKFFVFRFLNAENGNEIRGEVHLQESNKSTQYQAFKANEMIDILAPRNKAGVYFLTTIAPGYKVFEETFNYTDPIPESSSTGSDGELVIPITLERAKRGDYIEFNSVGFYRNSVIMQPQLKDELDGLATLMKENKGYQVRIHGHCNGNEQRNIVTLGKSTKYFESDATNVRKTGSAKELTDLRAESAKRYLVSQGVEEDRIETKGEGGKEMVYPQNSVYSNYNDRIEVEVIRH